MKKLRLAIAGFTACSGCQLTLLNCEAELLQLAQHFEFSYFPLACSTAKPDDMYDALLVEGCISTIAEECFLQELRQKSGVLIAIGSCAANGGIPAMPIKPMSGKGEDITPPRPLHDLVRIDRTLYGCPPEKHEILALLSDLLRGVFPPALDYPVCTECTMRENRCLLTQNRQLCLGALTLGGCNARCPSLSVPCEGCRGPVPDANIPASLKCYAEYGYDTETVMDRLGRFFPRENQ